MVFGLGLFFFLFKRVYGQESIQFVLGCKLSQERKKMSLGKPLLVVTALDHIFLWPLIQLH